MKKYIYIFIYVCIAFGGLGTFGCSNEDTELRQPVKKDAVSSTRSYTVCCTIENLVAGKLEERLTAALEEEGVELSSLQSLTVTGEFSYDDAYYLRNSVKQIQALDLSGVTQLKTSESYYDDEAGEWKKQYVDTDKIEANMFCNLSSMEEILLPEIEIAIIDDYSFYNCTKLKSFKCPEKLRSIENSVFLNCESLESVTFSEGLHGIGRYTFQGCSKLKNVEIQDSVNTISSFAFYNCSSLEEMVIPRSVTSLGVGVFYGCTSLKSLTIDASVENIPSYFCIDCSSLTEVNLSDSIQSVSESAFKNTQLSDFSPFEKMSFSGSSHFVNCNFEEADLSNLQTIPSGFLYGCSKLNHVTFSDQLTQIGSNAFRETNLQSVELPNTLESIGANAFYGTQLSEINIPNSVTTIWGMAFSETKIRTITIPESVTSVGTYLFSYCPYLVGVFWNSSVEVPYYSTTDQRNCFLYLTTSADGTVASYDSSWDNMVIVDGVAENIVLKTGKCPYGCPQAFTAKSISYSTEFNPYSYNYTGYGTSANWKTIALPFTPTVITCGETFLAPFNSDVEGAKPFWLRTLTADGFENVTTIQADSAYIIAMPYNPNLYLDEYNIRGTVTFKAENVEIKETTTDADLPYSEGPSFTMYPTYTYIPKAGNIYALNTDGTFDDVSNRGSKFVRSYQAVYPFEAYVKSSTMRSSISMDGTRASSRTATTRTPNDDPRLKQRGVPKIDDM